MRPSAEAARDPMLDLTKLTPIRFYYDRLTYNCTCTYFFIMQPRKKRGTAKVVQSKPKTLIKPQPKKVYLYLFQVKRPQKMF